MLIYKKIDYRQPVTNDSGRDALRLLEAHKILVIPLLLLCAVMRAEASYTPPLGIPAPSFGIDEAHHMYDGAFFEAGGFAYKNAGNGPYTHYVDNKGECWDFVNPYGDPQKPRCTVPTELPPGSVVEIQSGTYNSVKLEGVVGKPDKPIFIRGSNQNERPRFVESPGIYIQDSSYVVVENLITDGSALSNSRSTAGLIIRQPSNHISVRYVESRNYPMPDFCPKRKGGVGCWFGTVWGIGADKRWKRGGDIENIVLYKNHIHHNGDYVPKYESGRHAINVSGGTRGVWILENRLEYNAEDGIQIYWRKGGSRGQPAEKVYIGRNIIGNNGENAIDVKQSYDVIISENELYGYRPTDFPASGSDGSAIVLNDDAPNDKLWVINNRIYDSAKGIRSQTSGRAYVVGNLFYDIADGNQEPSSPGRGWGVGIWSSSAKQFHVVQNTFYDASGGIYAISGDEIYIKNNVISHLGISSGTKRGYHIALNNKNFDNIEVDHNLIYQPQNKVRFRGASCDLQCLEGDDPNYVDPSKKDFSLSRQSPAIDAGGKGKALGAGDVYQIFSSFYGLDIKKDILGNDREIGDGIDIGAHEYKGSPR